MSATTTKLCQIALLVFVRAGVTYFGWLIEMALRVTLLFYTDRQERPLIIANWDVTNPFVPPPS
jgi:hypothetical protein